LQRRAQARNVRCSGVQQCRRKRRSRGVGRGRVQRQLARVRDGHLRRTSASRQQEHKTAAAAQAHRRLHCAWHLRCGVTFALVAPLWEPTASTFSTTSMPELEVDSGRVSFLIKSCMFLIQGAPSRTRPKTTWRPSSQEVFTVVMKNWEPFES
jgi:hypothetical protein